MCHIFFISVDIDSGLGFRVHSVIFHQVSVHLACLLADCVCVQKHCILLCLCE